MLLQLIQNSGAVIQYIVVLKQPAFGWWRIFTVTKMPCWHAAGCSTSSHCTHNLVERSSRDRVREEAACQPHCGWVELVCLARFSVSGSQSWVPYPSRCVPCSPWQQVTLHMGGSSSLETSLAFCSTSTALLKAVQSACGCVVKLWELDINMLEMELEEADLDICPPDFFSKKNRNLCSHGPPLLSFSRYWKDSCHLPFLRFL